MVDDCRFLRSHVQLSFYLMMNRNIYKRNTQIIRRLHIFFIILLRQETDILQPLIAAGEDLSEYLPETPAEKLICLADKFFSKSGDRREKSLDRIRSSLAKFGPEAVDRFDALETGVYSEILDNLVRLGLFAEIDRIYSKYQEVTA